VKYISEQNTIPAKDVNAPAATLVVET